MGKVEKRVLLLAMAGWVVFSPYFWWANVRSKFGVSMPLIMMIVPLAISLVGLVSVPFLLLGCRKPAVAVMFFSAFMMLWFLSGGCGFYSGGFLNAALLLLSAVVGFYMKDGRMQG